MEQIENLVKMLHGDEGLLANAAMYFRHDYGLLSQKEQEDLRHEAKEWLRACVKAAGFKG
jgi:hypothetical protein